MKLLIGASSSKIFHLKEFAQNLEKNNIGFELATFKLKEVEQHYKNGADAVELEMITQEEFDLHMDLEQEKITPEEFDERIQTEY